MQKPPTNWKKDKGCVIPVNKHKLCQKSIPKDANRKTTKPLDLIHSDVAGKITSPSKGDQITL